MSSSLWLTLQNAAGNLGWGCYCVRREEELRIQVFEKILLTQKGLIAAKGGVCVQVCIIWGFSCSCWWGSVLLWKTHIAYSTLLNTNGGHRSCKSSFALFCCHSPTSPYVRKNSVKQYFVQLGPNSTLSRLYHIGDMSSIQIWQFSHFKYLISVQIQSHY
jgi:hypothetical protein